MIKIEEYRFGYMKINDKEYRNDLIIFKDKIMANWWRKEGHNLFLDDFKDIDIEDKELDCFIVGKGYSGVMEIDKNVIEFFKKRNLKIFTGKTQDAVKKYNEEVEKGKKILAGFHLTC